MNEDQRELIVHTYINAWDECDLEVMLQCWETAEEDDELERIMLGVQDTINDEYLAHKDDPPEERGP